MGRSLQVVIEMDNAAFDELPGAELARLLEGLAADYRQCGPVRGQLALWDVNGNRVGYAKIIEGE